MKAIGTYKGKSVEVELEVGESLADLVSIYGEEVVYKCARADIKARAKSTIIGFLKRGHSVHIIKERMKTWAPIRRVRTCYDFEFPEL